MTPCRRCSVLIVDDTLDIRWLLRLALDRDGSFEVVGEGGDGRAAVELAERLQPDAILLDLAMPVMDGLQALPLLRQVSPASRVVVLAGVNAGQLAGEAMALGAHGYIEKGTAPAELIARLSEVCCPPGPAGSEAEPPRRTPPAPAGSGPTGQPDGAVSVPGVHSDWGALLVHELATPLTALIGFAQLLEDGWPVMPAETRQRTLAGIGRSARYMRTVLSNLADVGNIDLDALDLVLEDADITQLLVETVADLAGTTSSTRVRLILPGPVIARVDRTRIRQVVTNLVCNATKFAGPDADVAVHLDADDHLVHISVIDDGPGICRSRQPELFQKFSRAGATAPGKGLGLYVSRGIVRAHGGDITIDSDAGSGARFTVRLPRTPSPSAAAAPVSVLT